MYKTLVLVALFFYLAQSQEQSLLEKAGDCATAYCGAEKKTCDNNPPCRDNVNNCSAKFALSVRKNQPIKNAHQDYDYCMNAAVSRQYYQCVKHKCRMFVQQAVEVDYPELHKIDGYDNALTLVAQENNQ